MAPPRIDPATRFNAKYVVQPNDCWQWIGPSSLTSNGWRYGMFRPGGKANNVGAHRWSYEHHKSAIPRGMHLDHLCRNTLCVNPDHLEAVTVKTNINRGRRANAEKTHCIRGHAFTPENTYRTKHGTRRCRKCHVLDEAARRNDSTLKGT